MSAFIISLPALERNALILRDVADAAGCRIALALKGFPAGPVLRPCPLAGRLLRFRPVGGTAGPAQVREACADLFSGHAPEEIAELAEISSHLDFNSLTQWSRFRRK